MVINNRKELEFCIKADRMINRGVFTYSLKEWIKNFIVPDYIIKYLKAMRCYSYYSTQSGVINRFFKLYWAWLFRKLGLKLGFSIGKDVFGYGLFVPHYGTIVIGQTNSIGNFALIQPTSTIDGSGHKIGDAFCLCTGAKVIGNVNLENNVIVGANAFLNKTYKEENIILGGIPATIVGKRGPWYEIDPNLLARVRLIEQLKDKMCL